MTAGPDLYLASASPRRRALLEQIGVAFTVLRLEVDESRLAGEDPVDYVSRLALAKAQAGRALLETDDPRPVLGADTAVVIDGRILGKPRDREDALAMLARLSGRTHRVASAVALAGADAAVRVSISRVRFRTLDAAERAAYWETGEPRDKAGAYAIQGRAAGFIERLEGSYSGVMGLPLFETVELFKKYKINIL